MEEEAQDWPAWLALADALAARGDSRGAHIELEHRLAHALCPEERAQLQRQVDAAVATQQDRWLLGWSRPPGAVLRWRRGFVRELHFGPPSPLPELLASLEALRAHPAGERLWGLGFAGVPLGDEGAEQLARCGALAGLHRLVLAVVGLTDAGALALARSPHLAGLELLDVGGNRLGVEGARALAALPLVRLELGGNPIPPQERASIEGCARGAIGWEG
jgi:hypothetical protein